MAYTGVIDPKFLILKGSTKLPKVSVSVQVITLLYEARGDQYLSTKCWKFASNEYSLWNDTQQHHRRSTSYNKN